MNKSVVQGHKIIKNEKHSLQALSKEELDRVRTFSKFDDDPSYDQAHVLFKVANSKWNKQKFDISSLQKTPLYVKGKGDYDDLT